MTLLGILIRHAELHIPNVIDLKELTVRVTGDVNAHWRIELLPCYRDALHLQSSADVLEGLLKRHRHDDLLSRCWEKYVTAQGEGFEPPTLRFRAGCSAD